MPWQNLQLTDFTVAMSQCDNIGIQAFREFYGFYPAKKIHMTIAGKETKYEARPLIAAAYAMKHPNSQKLSPPNFKNNNAHLFLESIGFKINHF